MNEKPGLEPGFFCSTSWLLGGLALLPVPSACLTCRFEISLARARKRTISYRSVAAS